MKTFPFRSNAKPLEDASCAEAAEHSAEIKQNFRLLFHAKWFEVTTVDVPNFQRGIAGEQCEENQINHGTSIAKLQQRQQQLSDKRPDCRMAGKPGGSRGRVIGGFRCVSPVEW